MSNSKQNSSFANQFAELEAIVEWFEQEEIDLDNALKQFEKGMKLSEELRKKLVAVENKVETLKKTFDNGS